MSQNNYSNEEVDILEFFRAIGNFINFLYNKLKDLLSGILLYTVKFLLFLKRKSLYLGLGVLAGLIIALILKKDYLPMYISSIDVKLNYNSYETLNNKFNVFNTLIDDEEYDTLAKELNINPEEAARLEEFTIYPIKNDIVFLKSYNKFMKELDSISHEVLDYNTYKQNLIKHQNFLSRFTIYIKAESPGIFKKLNSFFEKGLEDNPILAQKKRNYLEVLRLKKDKLMQSLHEVDSLRKVLNEVYLKSSVQSNDGVMINNGSFQPEKPYDLFQKRISLLKDLQLLNTDLLEKGKVIYLYNEFPERGEKMNIVTYNPFIRYPAYGFLAALFIILLFELNKQLHKIQRKLEKNEDN